MIYGVLQRCKLPEYRIAIMHHEAIRLVADPEAPELLRRRLGRRVFCDIPMQNPTGADLQHQEHVDEPECSGDRHKEIARQCLGSRDSAEKSSTFAAMNSAGTAPAVACTA
jgi:hypothetical protein